MQHSDILIAGGGLAGLTSAIHLASQGLSVVLVEKDSYPHHKVCGEYISNEVLPYLRALDADPAVLSPANITHLQFTTAKGNMLEATLPLGGFGVSRYRLDHFLYEKALAAGVRVVQDTITEVSGTPGNMQLSTQSGKAFHGQLVMGSFGKRSSLDVKMQRPFIQQKSPWLAVKAHYTGEHPEHIVGLHTFDGGYCGISKVEDGIINICYLVRFESFKQYKNIDEHRERVLYRNPVLRKVFSQVQPLFEKPLTISQVSFARKAAVENHMLMCGDTAGLIHPFCGNGMAMAMHSAKIASDLALQFIHKEVNADELEQQYTQQWNDMFLSRINAGRHLSGLLRKPALSALLTGAMGLFPGLLPLIISKTHGEPIKITNDAYRHAV